MKRLLIVACFHVILLGLVFTTKVGQAQGGRFGESENAPPVSPSPGVAIPTASGKPERIQIVVEDSRPLGAAAAKLQLKFGIPVSYEDIEWVFQDDLMQAGKFPNPEGRRLPNPDVLVPSLGFLQIGFDVDSGTRISLTSPEDILRSLVEEHMLRRNPGEFRLVKLGEEEGFSIVPSRSKNAAGEMVPARSLLDARISFPAEERDGKATVKAIFDALNVATGARFAVFDDLPLGRLTAGATNEVARDILVRVLRDGYDWKVSWHLNYSPAEGYWGVNFNAVYKETGRLTAQGRPEIQPVRWPNRPLVRQ